MTDAQKRNEQWRGILFGLAREDAGIDWALETVAGQEQVQAHTTITSGSVSMRIDLDATLAGAAGDAGNDWTAAANPANLSTDPSSARISRANAANPSVRIIVEQAGSTFAAIAALVNAVAGLRATVSGSGATAFPNTVAQQSSPAVSMPTSWASSSTPTRRPSPWNTSWGIPRARSSGSWKTAASWTTRPPSTACSSTAARPDRGRRRRRSRFRSPASSRRARSRAPVTRRSRRCRIDWHASPSPTSAARSATTRCPRASRATPRSLGASCSASSD